MVTERFMMIAVEGLEVNHFRWNRKIEGCREISKVKRGKMEQIDYLLCLITWKKNTVVYRKLIKSINRGTGLLEAESKVTWEKRVKGINF